MGKTWVFLLIAVAPLGGSIMVHQLRGLHNG